MVHESTYFDSLENKKSRGEVKKGSLKTAITRLIQNPKQNQKKRRGSARYTSFQYGSQIKFSFVLMLIRLSSLATKSKFQKNFCFKMRPVGLINIKSKESKSGHHLRKWSAFRLLLNVFVVFIGQLIDGTQNRSYCRILYKSWHLLFPCG